MLIHKAWYGPRGGHSLVAWTTEHLVPVFRGAAWLTDLPGTVPTGTEWQPYFRTAIYENYFILVHTRANQEVSRAGMVDSVAAFIPLDDLTCIQDIKRIADHVAQSHDSEERNPLEVDEHELEPVEELSPLPLLEVLANTLIEGNKRPMVHLGQQDFDKAMLELLQRVPPQLRKEILFSISFSPEDIRDSIAVCLPAPQLGTRFPSNLLLPQMTSEVGLHAGASALLNRAEGVALRRFAQSVGFTFESIKSLNLLEASFQLWLNGNSVSDTIGLVRFMAAKSGEEKAAQDMRANALSKLIAESPQWLVSNVLAMRNLELSRFADSVKLQEELRRWSKGFFEHGRPVSEQEVKLLEQAAQNNAIQWWNTALQEGLVAAMASNSVSTSIFVWTVIQKLPSVLEQLLNLVDKAKNGFQALTINIPSKIDPTIADAVAKSSANRGAWRLCGAVLAISHQPHVAVAMVISLHPPKADRIVAIEAALSRASGKQLVDAAVQADLPESTMLAASALLSDSRLLNGFDWTSPVWFEILQQAALSSPRLVADLPARAKGMEALIARGEKSERIWDALSQTELANLCDLSNRARAWSLVPSDLRQPILTATCKGWMATFESSGTIANPLEEPLRKCVLERLSEPGYLPDLASRAPSLFSRCIANLYPPSEHECLQLINALARDSHKRFGPVAANALGRLVRERGWSHAASRAAGLAQGRTDFLEVCRECLSLLGFLDRLSVSFRLGEAVELPANEAWEILEDELAKIYPRGPTDQDVWSRSGGKNEELWLEGNGVAQWHRSIKQIRAGGGPKVFSLMMTALSDFSRNETLRNLQSSGVLD